jgi:hypothetical protein
MDSLISSVDSQAVLVISAVAVALLLGTLLFRILVATWGLILAILAIGLVMQYGFGISPRQLWEAIGHLPQDVTQLVKSFDLNAFTSMFSS